MFSFKSIWWGITAHSYDTFHKQKSHTCTHLRVCSLTSIPKHYIMSHYVMFLCVLVERTVVCTWQWPVSVIDQQFSRSTTALDWNRFATCNLKSTASEHHIMKISEHYVTSHQVMFLCVLMERTVVQTWKRPSSVMDYQFCRSTAALDWKWLADCHVQSGVSEGHITKKSFPQHFTCK